jgi:chemotaxis protein methyltransferase WspC
MNLPEHIALIFSVLRREIGLDPESVGHRSLEAAVERRAQELELSLDAYALRVQTSSEERRALIERVVVPETWFFRDRAPFDFLARVANAEWRHRDRQVRVLSIPCSTGEEPYSISMCFLDQGIPPACFAIEACDISEAALERARRASYTAIAFRGSDLNYRDRHFVPLPDGRFELEPRARAPVTFRYANILDLDKLAPPASFDAIFSRNLLIYLEPDIREKAAESFFTPAPVRIPFRRPCRNAPHFLPPLRTGRGYRRLRVPGAGGAPIATGRRPPQSPAHPCQDQRRSPRVSSFVETPSAAGGLISCRRAGPSAFRVGGKAGRSEDGCRSGKLLPGNRALPGRSLD